MAKVALDSKAMSIFLVPATICQTPPSTQHNQLSEEKLKKGVHPFPDFSSNTEQKPSLNQTAMLEN